MGMIEETVTRFVAAADWTDDCKVEIQVRKKRTILNVAQARDFAEEVLRAADTAESASNVRTVPSHAGFDSIEHLGPDCRDGKHSACVGDAWSVADDAATPCTCPCHWDTITEEQA